MNTKRLSYRSVESPETPYPWYVVEVQEGGVAVTEDKDGGRRSDGLSVAKTEGPDHVDLPESASQPTNGAIWYAVTEGGKFIAFDPDADPDLPDLRITLGWYFESGGVHYHGNERIDVGDDTLLLLDFVER